MGMISPYFLFLFLSVFRLETIGLEDERFGKRIGREFEGKVRNEIGRNDGGIRRGRREDG